MVRSKSTTSGAARNTTPRPELIEDAEIASQEEDKLGHHEITGELLALIDQTPTPANIALYGSWGSGKSGIGRLLRAEIENGKRKNTMRFARFDAFKYAQNPLRRNFISIVASELGIKDAAYKEDLYRATTSSNVQFPFTNMMKLIGLLALVVFGVLVVVGALVAIFAALNNKPVWDALVGAAALAVPSSLVPATVLTALVALASKTFTSTHTSERAESDEQFEWLFKRLVERAGKHKLVIFVDELDRCSPSDVIETLDTVRTFFGVPGCVFIVAADQQVLDQAMTTKLRQTTPFDDVNPYYSAGSSYLDKVFQYQIAVPPLRPQSVTAFAAAMVAGRSGVWAEVNTSVVASILVPAHVRSPRRVKHLLNSYVLAYRLAKSRQGTGLLHEDVQVYAEALARVVCLQVEFPLFARDMIADPDLPEHVLRFQEKGAEYWKSVPAVPPEMQSIVKGYAKGDRRVNMLVASSTGDPDADLDAGKRTEKAYSGQLLGYLERTASIRGPYRDLLFMESPGVSANLPASVATVLETTAQNGVLTGVRSSLEELSDTEKASALQFLLQVLHAAVGVEAPNVARSILVACELTSISPATAEAVFLQIDSAAPNFEGVITPATVAGAWVLAEQLPEAKTYQLTALILNQPFIAEDDAHAAATLDHVDLLRHRRKSLGEIITSRLLVETPNNFVGLLEGKPATTIEFLFDSIGGDLADRLRPAIEEHNSWEKAKSDAAAAANASTRRVAAPETEDEEDLVEPFDPAPVLDRLTALGQTLEKREAFAALASLVDALLQIERVEGRNAAEPLVSSLPPALTSDRRWRLITSATKRHVSTWAKWTSSVEPKEFASDSTAVPTVKNMLSTLWTRRLATSNPDSQEAFGSGAEAIGHLIDHFDSEQRDALNDDVVNTSETVSTSDDAVQMATRLVGLDALRDANVLTESALHAFHLTVVTDALAADVDVDDVPDVEDVVLDIAHRWIASASPDEEAEVKQLLALLSDAEWASTQTKLELRNSLCAQLPELASVSPVAGLSVAEIEELVGLIEVAEEATAVADWLRYTTADVSKTLPVVKPHLRSGSPVLPSVTSWLSRRTASQRLEFVTILLGAPSSNRWPDDVLGSLAFPMIDDADIADLLIARYEKETNSTGRDRVIEIWRNADVKSEASRRRLIDTVLIGMLSKSLASATTALHNAVLLCKPVPAGSRNALRAALIDCADERKDLRKKVDAVLVELELRPRKRSLFGG